MCVQALADAESRFQAEMEALHSRADQAQADMEGRFAEFSAAYESRIEQLQVGTFPTCMFL